jgi:hypothetical protein
VLSVENHKESISNKIQQGIQKVGESHQVIPPSWMKNLSMLIYIENLNPLFQAGELKL